MSGGTTVYDGLIEAYWNVNLRQLSGAVTVYSGLIEAYWNVNLLQHMCTLAAAKV